MKKIIILLLTILLSACMAVKPAETLSSMQTESEGSETTVADTLVTDTAKETIPMEVEAESPASETVVAVQKEDSSEPPVDEHPKQKPTPETAAETTVEAPAEPTKTETATESPTTAKAPAETAKEGKPRIPPTVETPLESDTEPPKAEFDINYWVNFTRAYALQIGLEIDETAVDCWDNPTTANADCIYLERDLTHRLDRYNRDENITAVNIWAESLDNENYLIYIAYA